MNRPAITVVIPTLGMVPLLDLCVQHLRSALSFENSHADDRIVLIDNATPDPIDQHLIHGRDIIWMRFDQPHSFSACCNAGMKKAVNPLYLMLNNDVILHSQAITAMLNSMHEYPDAGICGSRLIFPNGKIQHCGVRFSGDDIGPYHELRTENSSAVPRTTQSYQAVTAACMLIKQEVIDQLNGFDELYPFSFEDVDICLRARQAGWRVICCHDHDSIHFESMTPGRKTHDEAALAFFMSRWKGKWSTDG